MSITPRNTQIIFFVCFGFIISLISSPSLLSIEKSIEPTLSVIRNELMMKANLIVDEIKKQNIDTIYSNIKINEADRFFNSILLEKADSTKIAFFIDDLNSSKTPYLDIKTDINTIYSNDEEDSDYIIRNIIINFSGSIRLTNGRLLPLDMGHFDLKDKIIRQDAVLYNDTSYDFAKADIPEEPDSFWKDIIQPIAIIGAATITVVLLFTMRSN